MRGVNHARSLGHLVKLIDEDRTFFSQIGHYIAVVNDFLSDIDRRAKRLKCNLHNINGPHYTSAETTRLQQQNTLGCRGFSAPLVLRTGEVGDWGGNGFEDRGAHTSSIPLSAKWSTLTN